MAFEKRIAWRKLFSKNDIQSGDRRTSHFCSAVVIIRRQERQGKGKCRGFGLEVLGIVEVNAFFDSQEADLLSD